MRAIAIGSVVAAILALPASALAVNCAPPGASGVDQYLETIPGASCSAPFPDTGVGGDGHQLTPRTVRQLEAQGSVGIAVERLVASTGQAGELSGTRGAGRPAGHRRRGGTKLPPAASPRPVPSAVLRSTISASAADDLLALWPLLLTTVLLLTIGTVVGRRRQKGPDS